MLTDCQVGGGLYVKYCNRSGAPFLDSLWDLRLNILEEYMVCTTPRGESKQWCWTYYMGCHSTPLLNTLIKMEYGTFFKCSISGYPIWLVWNAYVDNINLIGFNTSEAELHHWAHYPRQSRISIYKATKALAEDRKILFLCMINDFLCTSMAGNMEHWLALNCDLIIQSILDVWQQGTLGTAPLLFFPVYNLPLLVVHGQGRTNTTHSFTITPTRRRPKDWQHLLPQG